MSSRPAWAAACEHPRFPKWVLSLRVLVFKTAHVNKTKQNKKPAHVPGLSSRHPGLKLRSCVWQRETPPSQGRSLGPADRVSLPSFAQTPQVTRNFACFSEAALGFPTTLSSAPSPLHGPSLVEPTPRGYAVRGPAAWRMRVHVGVRVHVCGRLHITSAPGD